MARIVIRKIDNNLIAKLRRRAHRHARSLEDEVCEILRNAVQSENETRPRLGSRLAARFRGLGLTDEIPELRGQSAEPAVFEP